MKISIFGTGLMGKPIALRLAEAGHNVSVYNRTRSKTYVFKQHDIHVSASVRETVQKSELLIIILADYPAIHETFQPDQALDFGNKTFIQMGTISPGQSLDLKEFFTKRGAEYLEAPVLGSVPQVENGTLFILFGGNRSQFNCWEKKLSHLGDKRYFLGQVGNAMAVKLALNQLIISLTVAFSMSLGFIQKKGLDIEIFMNILRQSALYAPTFDKKLHRMMKRNFVNPNFPLKHLLKDLNLILDEFSQSGIAVDSLKKTGNLLSRAMDQGYADLDYSALYNVINPIEKK
jgi:3-hydroxyisobutyrate dehydrogenase